MEDEGLDVIVEYTEAFNLAVSSSLPLGNIYVSHGFSVHIKKRHPNCTRYVERISEIIEGPDYIGHNPNEPDSIELIKTFDQNIQIAIKLDMKLNYLYVASLYEVKQGKINRRLMSGRLKAYVDKTKGT